MRTSYQTCICACGYDRCRNGSVIAWAYICDICAVRDIFLCFLPSTGSCDPLLK